jgi:hypothetical protein
MLLTDVEVAVRLGVRPVAVRVARHRGLGPKYHRMADGAIRYRPEDVDEYLRNHRSRRRLQSTPHGAR